MVLTSNYKILPVLVTHNAEIARNLAEALIDENLPIVEVTLRTPESWRAIETLASIDGLTVGIGSVTKESELDRAAELGLKFAVSAGLSSELVEAANSLDIDYLPGVATPTEILMALRLGLTRLKWFPATALGGIASLRSVSAPFPEVKFIPTGGINFETARDYLREPNVAQVGGSWMFQSDWLKNRDFEAVRKSIKTSIANLKIES